MRPVDLLVLVFSLAVTIGALSGNSHFPHSPALPAFPVCYFLWRIVEEVRGRNSRKSK